MYIIVVCVTVLLVWLLWKYWTLLVGAGYDPTPMDKVHKMLELAKVDQDDVIYDLGCGDGRIITTAAKAYGARAVGVEVDPFRYIFSRLMVVLSGTSNKVQVRFGNFFNVPLTDATVVTLFLFQPANNRLAVKMKRELRTGTRIVSYVWTLEGWQPAGHLPEDRIFLYVVE